MEFDLQPRSDKTGLVPPVRFTFDPETENFGGPDSDLIARFVKLMREDGTIQVIPCYAYSLGEHLTLKDLGAILGFYWDLRDYDFPAIEIPRDPDMPEGAVF